MIHQLLALLQKELLDCAVRQSTSAHVSIRHFLLSNPFIRRFEEKTPKKGAKSSRFKVSPEV